MAFLKTAKARAGALLGINGGRAANAFPGSRVDEKYPSRPSLSLDQKDLLGRMQHRELLNSGRHIYNAFPMVSGAINDIANHAVGDRWQAQYRGDDIAYERAAERWMESHARIVDVRGYPFTLQNDLHVGVQTLARDGEFFIYFTHAEGAYPLIQFLESHRIGIRSGQWDSEIMEGPYAGLQQRNGIAYNEYSRPVAYHYLGDLPEDDRWISSAHIMHVYDPKWFSQGRGISPLVYGILDWLDVSTWRENEKMAQIILSSIGMIEANEEGGPDNLQARMRAAVAGAAEATAEKPKTETFVSGMVRYIKLNGSNLKSFEHQRQHPNASNFEEKVLRGCFRALGWTYEQALDSKGQGGANVRRDVAQNQRSIEHMQNILLGPWTRIIIYSLSVAEKLGLVQNEAGPVDYPPDWWKWRPQLPQKMTVDHGRDRKVDLDEIRTGTRTMIRDIRDHGDDEETHLDEQIKFYKLKKQKAMEADIPDDKWTEVFGSLLINPSNPQPKEEENKDEPDRS